MIEGFPQIVVGEVLAKLLRVLVRGSAHGLGHEPHWIGQGVLWLLEPQNAPGDGPKLGYVGQILHGVTLPGQSGAAATSAGNRPRSVPRAAAAIVPRAEAYPSSFGSSGSGRTLMPSSLRSLASAKVALPQMSRFSASP